MSASISPLTIIYLRLASTHPVHTCATVPSPFPCFLLSSAQSSLLQCSTKSSHVQCSTAIYRLPFPNIGPPPIVFSRTSFNSPPSTKMKPALLSESYIDTGSGSSYLYGFLDQSWKDGMTKDKAEQLVEKSVSLTITRNGASGGV